MEYIGPIVDVWVVYQAVNICGIIAHVQQNANNLNS